MSAAAEMIREHLFSLADESYRDFCSALVPNVPAARFIGVRVPALRAYARELYSAHRDCAEEFLNALPHGFFDEDNLHGFIIERIGDFDGTIRELERFLPYVSSWATCDMCSPKVLKKEPDKLLRHIEVWLNSGRTYTVRFGLGRLMSDFLGENFAPGLLELAASVNSDDYYVKMMKAWYFATALALRYEEALPFIENNVLDAWTHNKTIQKAVESRRIGAEQKAYLRTLRRSAALKMERS